MKGYVVQNLRFILMEDEAKTYCAEKDFSAQPELVEIDKTSLIYDHTKFHGKQIPLVAIGNHTVDFRPYPFFTCGVCGKQSQFRVGFVKREGGMEKICVECAALTGVSI